MIIYLEKSIASQMTGPHAESNILFIDQLLMADYLSDHAVFIDSKFVTLFLSVCMHPKLSNSGIRSAT